MKTFPVSSNLSFVVKRRRKMKTNKNAEFWKSILAGTNLPNNDAGLHIFAFYFINLLIFSRKIWTTNKNPQVGNVVKVLLFSRGK